MTANILSGHRCIPPYGMNGGGTAKTGENTLIQHNGVQKELPWSTTIEVEEGDVLHIKTPGGGGYGKTQT